MRDAGQDQGAVLFLRLKITGHPVERAAHLGDFAGACLGQRGRHAAAADRIGGQCQRAQRPGDPPHHQIGADQCQQQRQRAPAKPLPRHRRLHAVASQPHPVIIVIDAKADPHAFHAVAPECNPGIGTGLGADQRFDAAETLAFRRTFQLLVRLGRVDLDALRDRNLAHQVGPGFRSRADQCGACQVDDRRDLLRDLLAARFALVEAENLDPCQHRHQEQEGDDEKGAP